ncbi:RagB/SusD family nutrient uptake outer membrane protein [Chitinophaga sp. MM2321]|uniref:RagB/SusD family nutrient uptake outer membrane protein n=1 Tax=Chitinophaga sp. MM2321 TaxID=3137178 RepID=UPI0032D57F29
MKRIIYLLGFLGILLSTSCKKILDQAPELDYDEVKVFNDIDLTSQFLTDIYANTLNRPGSFMDLGNSPLAAACDEADNSFAGTPSDKFQNGSWNASDNPESVWGTCYATIRKCNLFLSKIDNVPNKYLGLSKETDLTPQRMKGEAYFLRAYNYFELLKRYGGIPIIKEPLGAGDEALRLATRASYDEVVVAILSDLDNCFNNPEIPLVWFGSNPSNPSLDMNRGNIGRATKTLVKALKSRLLLYYASPLNNPSNDLARWQAAADISKSIIADGKYSLFNSYQNIFLFSDNNEVMLTNQAEAFNAAVAEPAGIGWGGTNPTQDLIDKYEMKNGKLITDLTSGYDPQDPYKDRDPRLAASINYHGVTYQNTVLSMLPGGNQDPAIGGDWTKTGYYMRKFQNANSQSGVKRYFPIFRFAEIYLNYAEAQNEAAGPSPDVYEAVNVIRRRAGIADLPTGLSQADLRKRIWNERAVEMAFEKQRFWDVRRWKIAESTLGVPIHGIRVTKNGDGSLHYNIIKVEDRVFKPEMYLYPVPQSEMDKNPTVLVQNPGWN